MIRPPVEGDFNAVYLEWALKAMGEPKGPILVRVHPDEVSRTRGLIGLRPEPVMVEGDPDLDWCAWRVIANGQTAGCDGA